MTSKEIVEAANKFIDRMILEDQATDEQIVEKLEELMEGGDPTAGYIYNYLSSPMSPEEVGEMENLKENEERGL